MNAAPPPAEADPTLEWQQFVGKALLRFGDIEYTSVKCLEKLPTDRIASTASSLPFAKRAELLIEILEGRENPDEHTNQLLVGFRHAKKLAHKRNLIAHNPLLLEMYFHGDSEEVTRMEHAISSARSSEHRIDLAELKDFADEVDGLASEIGMAYLHVSGEIDAILRDKGKATD